MAASVVSPPFTASTTAEPLRVTRTPPAESTFAGFPAASVNVILTNEPLSPSAPAASTTAVAFCAATVAFKDAVAEAEVTTTETVCENYVPFTVPESSRSLKNTQV